MPISKCQGCRILMIIGGFSFSSTAAHTLYPIGGFTQRPLSSAAASGGDTDSIIATAMFTAPFMTILGVVVWPPGSRDSGGAKEAILRNGTPATACNNGSTFACTHSNYDPVYYQTASWGLSVHTGTIPGRQQLRHGQKDSLRLAWRRPAEFAAKIEIRTQGQPCETHSGRCSHTAL